MTAPVALRHIIVEGAVFDVENHYINKPDHPCFGVTRRTITRVNGNGFHMWGEASNQRQDWPKVSQFTVEDGVVKIFGGGVSQAPTDLFLTLTPIRETSPVAGHDVRTIFDLLHPEDEGWRRSDLLP